MTPYRLKILEDVAIASELHDGFVPHGYEWITIKWLKLHSLVQHNAYTTSELWAESHYIITEYGLSELKNGLAKKIAAPNCRKLMTPIEKRNIDKAEEDKHHVQERMQRNERPCYECGWSTNDIQAMLQDRDEAEAMIEIIQKERDDAEAKSFTTQVRAGLLEVNLKIAQKVIGLILDEIKDEECHCGDLRICLACRIKKVLEPKDE